MNQPRSGDYFERRAEEEREACRHATDVRAAQSHRELAKRYHRLARDYAEQVGREPELRRIQSRNFSIVS